MRERNDPGALAGATEAGIDDAREALDTKAGRRPQHLTRPKADPRDKTYFLAAKAYKACLDGKSFVPHTAELLASPAWRNRTINAMRFIDLLELEHAQHNGLENGYLKLTWRQMRAGGIGGDYIADTIA